LLHPDLVCDIVGNAKDLLHLAGFRAQKGVSRPSSQRHSPALERTRN
jgi:hypothetical protein